MAKIIFHIDMDAFFASCFLLDHPEWQKEPVVVASKRLVLTANYPARAYGLHSAQPLFMARNYCPDVKIVKPNYQQYQTYSHLIFQLLINDFSPIIEIASIDECYLDVSSIVSQYSTVESLGQAIQTRIRQATGLWCSVGISSTKFLAKMATNMQKPRGITILTEADLPTKLWPIPIEKAIGIGPKTSAVLKAAGITTIGAFINKAQTKAGEQQLNSLIGKSWSWFLAAFMGKTSNHLITIPNQPKSISSDETFDEALNQSEDLRIKLKQLARIVSIRAAGTRLVGKTVTCHFRTTDFKTTSKQITINDYINDMVTIYQLVWQLFQQWWQGQPLRYLSVGLTQLKPEHQLTQQLSLFTNQTQTQTLDLNPIEPIINQVNQKLNLTKVNRGDDVAAKQALSRHQSFKGEKSYRSDYINSANHGKIKPTNGGQTHND